ncbi:MAG: hypothetical protein HFACDABA_01031 [Anaerolineales bacterium]|nr:hypothetical protein [Anaerolineales bacterium]
MKNLLSAVFCVIALLISACSLPIQQAVPPEPTIIYVPVTVTTEPTQPQALPSATQEPLPTIAETATATIIPSTATPEILHFYVSGYVWHDTCKPYNPVPVPTPAGCIFEPGVGLYADGIFSAGEPGIGGVTVRLEIDCNYGAFTTQTDSGGFYKMSFTVPAAAGVYEQKICLSVDAGGASNASLLLPGGWTVPKTNSAAAVIQITIPVEKPNTVNFGWDYQFQ